MANNNNDYKIAKTCAKLIPLRSNYELAEKVSDTLDIPLTHTNIVNHANNEIKGIIGDNIRKCNVYLIGSGTDGPVNSVNDHIIEMCLIIDACKRSSAKSITLIIPYYPYSRSDKKDDGRTSIGGSLITKLLTTSGADRIVTMDLHSGQIQGFSDIPMDNLYAINLFTEYLTNTYFQNMTNSMINDKYVLISPDVGAIKRIKAYAQILKMKYAIMDKQRDYTKESVVLSSELYTQDDVTGKIAIIIDDMADTCGTMISACNELGKKGISKIIILVTHGIFSKNAIKRINSCDIVQDVIVTDSLPQSDHIAKCPKLQVVGISGLVSTVIKCLESGTSISELFN